MNINGAERARTPLLASLGQLLQQWYNEWLYLPKP